jgi:hypothetical protein
VLSGCTLQGCEKANIGRIVLGHLFGLGMGGGAYLFLLICVDFVTIFYKNLFVTLILGQRE